MGYRAFCSLGFRLKKEFFEIGSESKLTSSEITLMGMRLTSGFLIEA
ncbi:hypothetical protein LEP1GSC034_3084 [Leptospira interrogans str. 2003000735]|uniref:Uncharacterized protein n=14 Tax=Leptospira interrogans TaxID=173 RepID=A0A0E2D8B6_LEPIR|nr:hypothetical protein G436_1486 [Leptospira interrogans serovar Hardjo str. Norma]EJO80483.1 hypothetical protein LEP1GSC045_4320 [Leptospira interrogans serovar Pomona str. Kennewicki LC82-25]EJP05154.1 hypothetical protein LEP1GSC007_1287 [Leptospira interrogans serovar Bulgarica str. Mallika]EJP16943.1 hypothetical protein LEP1GSC080_2375 [Leptospira interrogans str. FPW2026]EKN86167.1 hypothetical protein LEP1GSC027_2708 [Leptospira interrogans str. 2002000624]EKN96762.1 hypothetical pro